MRRIGRRHLGMEKITALALGALSATVVVLVVLFPNDFPFTPLMVPLVLATLLLSRQRMVWFGLYTALCLIVVAAVQQDPTARTFTALIVQGGLCAAVVVTGLRRGVGLGRLRGESILVDLRDRILAQGQIPPLPREWLVESALASAGGSPFAGDFVVASADAAGRRLAVAVADVSGKGEAAATRALQLSGAMSGLLSALPAAEFLPATNRYLVEREWEEGFATAIHLALDLHTGDFEVRTAGHPPAVHKRAGSGRWVQLQSKGTVLGVTEDTEFVSARGRLGPGDALLLYTDGMVERSGRDIDLGIDAMTGVAERLALLGWERLGRRMVAAVGSPDDDRALVLVHRRSH